MLSVPLLPPIPSYALPIGPAGGDLSGSYPDPTVDGLQGNPVSAAAPAPGDSLVWNGSAWVPTLIAAPSGIPIVGVFSNSYSQDIDVLGGFTLAECDTTEMSFGVTVENDLSAKPTRFKVAQAGLFTFSISAQLHQDSGNACDITFWIRKMGNEVPNTATVIQLGNNNRSNAPYVLYTVPMQANEYVDFPFCANGDAPQIYYRGPLINPTRPANPSVIITARRLGDNLP